VLGARLGPAQEFGKEGGEWHSLFYTSDRVNASRMDKPMGTFEFCVGLLVPLYAARATEEVFYGRRGVTLSTSKEASAPPPPSTL
jgi:hypothetical protein